ncbi:MAG: hypothetical protein KC646_11835 [Candidatus Cloacimonetes bacterium]|nr:hypothetical protein [Candidatus Cloacimonadota bacterium]
MKKLAWITLFTYLFTIVFPVISYAKISDIDPNSLQMMIDVTEGKPADEELTGVFEQGMKDALVQELKLADFFLMTEAEKVIKEAFDSSIPAVQTKAQLALLSAIGTYRNGMTAAERVRMTDLLLKKGITKTLRDRIKDTYTMFRSHEQLFMDGEPEHEFLILKVKNKEYSPGVAVLGGLVNSGVIAKGSPQNRAKMFNALVAVVNMQDTGELASIAEESDLEAAGVNSTKGIAASGTAEAAEIGAKQAYTKSAKKLASALMRTLVNSATVTSMTQEHLNDPSLVKRIAKKAWSKIEKRVPKKSAARILKHARSFEKGLERVLANFSKDGIKKAIASAGSATAKAAIKASSSSIGKIVTKAVGGVFFAAVGDVLIDVAATLIVGQTRGSVSVGNDSYEYDSRKTTQQGDDQSFWNDRGAALDGLADDYQEHAITKTASTVGGAALGIAAGAAAVAFGVATGGVGFFLIGAVGAVAGAYAGSKAGEAYENSQMNKDRIKRNLIVRLTSAMKKMTLTKSLPTNDIKTLATNRRDDFVLRMQNRQYRHLIKLVEDFSEDSIQLNGASNSVQFKIESVKGEAMNEEAHTKYDFVDIKGFHGVWDMHDNKIVNVGLMTKTKGKNVELVLSDQYKKVSVQSNIIKGKGENDDFRVLSNQVVMAKAAKNGKWNIRGYSSNVDMFFRPLKKRFTWNKSKHAYVGLGLGEATIPESLKKALSGEDMVSTNPSNSSQEDQSPAPLQSVKSSQEDGNASYDYSSPDQSFMQDYGVMPSDNTAVSTPIYPQF